MLLSALLMAASCSESESEEIPPLGPRPGPGVRPGPSYLSDDGSDDEEQRQRPWSELNKTRRGSYDRTTPLEFRQPGVQRYRTIQDIDWFTTRQREVER